MVAQQDDCGEVAAEPSVAAYDIVGNLFVVLPPLTDRRERVGSARVVKDSLRLVRVLLGEPSLFAQQSGANLFLRLAVAQSYDKPEIYKSSDFPRAPRRGFLVSVL